MSSACLSAYRRALANPSFLSHFLPLPHLQKQNNIIQGWTIPNHQLIDSAGAVLQQMFVGCCAATDDCFVAGAVLDPNRGRVDQTRQGWVVRPRLVFLDSSPGYNKPGWTQCQLLRPH